jgi:hypothetical protein
MWPPEAGNDPRRAYLGASAQEREPKPEPGLPALHFPIRVG